MQLVTPVEQLGTLEKQLGTLAKQLGTPVKQQELVLCCVLGLWNEKEKGVVSCLSVVLQSIFPH
jgi:hypothetical protein